MTRKFKVGDKVKRVNDSENGRSGAKVVVGETYQVLGITSGLLQTDQCQLEFNTGWDAKNFVLVPEIDFTKPLRTKDGKKVEILSLNVRGVQPIAGYIGKNDFLNYWNSDGTYLGCKNSSEFDLENYEEDVVLEGYLNIYPNQGANMFHTTKESANTCASPSRIACVKISTTYKKGQFDE